MPLLRLYGLTLLLLSDNGASWSKALLLDLIRVSFDHGPVAWSNILASGFSLVSSSARVHLWVRNGLVNNAKTGKGKREYVFDHVIGVNIQCNRQGWRSLDQKNTFCAYVLSSDDEFFFHFLNLRSPVLG